MLSIPWETLLAELYLTPEDGSDSVRMFARFCSRRSYPTVPRGEEAQESFSISHNHQRDHHHVGKHRKNKLQYTWLLFMLMILPFLFNFTYSYQQLWKIISVDRAHIHTHKPPYYVTVGSERFSSGSCTQICLSGHGT